MSGKVKEFEIVVVNSKQRISGTDRSFHYNISLRHENYNYVSLLQFYMPKSYYLFDTLFNTFEVDNGGGSFETVTISPGNYNVTTLSAHLKTVLDATQTTWTVSHVVSTLRFTFSRTKVDSEVVRFRFGSSSFPAEALGFAKNTTYVFTSNSAHTLTAPFVMNLNLESTVILKTDKVPGGLLQEVFAAATPNYSAIQYLNPSPVETRKKITQMTSSFWTFFVTNEAGEIINSLNGQNVVFSMLFLHFEEKREKRDLLGTILNRSSLLIPRRRTKRKTRPLLEDEEDDEF